MVSALTAKISQTFLANNKKMWPPYRPNVNHLDIAFWDKKMWPPYRPNVNHLDISFWPHIERGTFSILHLNI
uniref:Uncharacterized protein n=1 Tax=Lepeophtheirus salmonis TaxID=72036 RepID=A0A0K2U090_LEPSM